MINLTLEEMDLLLKVVTEHGDKLVARSRYIKDTVTIEYYNERMKRLSDLRLKLIRLKQEGIAMSFKLRFHYSKDINGKILDPDL